MLLGIDPEVVLPGAVRQLVVLVTYPAEGEPIIRRLVVRQGGVLHQVDAVVLQVLEGETEDSDPSCFRSELIFVEDVNQIIAVVLVQPFKHVEDEVLAGVHFVSLADRAQLSVGLLDMFCHLYEPLVLVLALGSELGVLGDGGL